MNVPLLKHFHRCVHSGCRFLEPERGVVCEPRHFVKVRRPRPRLCRPRAPSGWPTLRGAAAEACGRRGRQRWTREPGLCPHRVFSLAAAGRPSPRGAEPVPGLSVWGPSTLDSDAPPPNRPGLLTTAWPGSQGPAEVGREPRPRAGPAARRPFLGLRPELHQTLGWSARRPSRWPRGVWLLVTVVAWPARPRGPRA